MSSTLRTIQKRILKRMGYTRQTKKVEMNELTGLPQIVPLKKGEGNIIGPDGHDTGSKQYPMFLPRPQQAEVRDAA
jgi:hypothetical protein